MLTSVAGRRDLGSFVRCEFGTAAIEFSFVLPILVTLLLGSVELFRLIGLNEKGVQVANAAGEMLSSSQVALTGADLQLISNSSMIMAPQALADARSRGVNWNSVLQTSFASVIMTAAPTGCSTSCSYTANVAWTAGSQRRPCGHLSVTADGSSYSPSTLPQSLFQSGSLIVVDSHYTYVPTLGSNLFSPITIHKSAYFVPRYVSSVAIGDTSANPAVVTRCPGY